MQADSSVSVRPFSPEKSTSVYECARFTSPKDRLLSQGTQKPLGALPIQAVNDKGDYHAHWDRSLDAYRGCRSGESGSRELYTDGCSPIVPAVRPVPAVTIEVTETATVNRVLAVGTVTESVTVQAGAETIQTESATVGGTLTGQSITDHSHRQP